MPKFEYTATNEENKKIDGVLEAMDTADLLQKLAKKGLRPVSVAVANSEKGFQKKVSLFGKKITTTDKIFLTKYIAIMLKVGTDLFQAINILIADFKKPALKKLLTEVRDNLEKGQPFYSTFAKYPDQFSPVFINLIKAGESSGTLEGAFEDINKRLIKEKELAAKVKGALVYPTILIVLSFLLLMFLMTFALPRLAAVFTGGGFDPPLFSKIVFAVGLFIDAHAIVIYSIVFLMVIGIVVVLKSKIGSRLFARVRTKLPVIKSITYQLAIQRFATTLSSLLRAGLPIMDALKITAEAVNHPDIEHAIFEAREDVSRGVTLGEAFRKQAAFPLVVTNLIAISEKAGHTDEILETLAVFYEGEIDAAMKKAVSLIEPVLLPIIGVIIGTIAVAIIIPVYQLVGQL
ncbi:MAG: type II secretion system F family protein [Candidatus Paceibacterota bacterium]